MLTFDDLSRQEIMERIAPVGQACERGQPCAERAGAVVARSAGPRSGEQIFNQFCTACHTSGLLKAPKIGDTAVWNKKLQAAGGFNNLLANAINGVGAMPAKGTCMDCADDEIQAAIEHMSGLKP